MLVKTQQFHNRLRSKPVINGHVPGNQLCGYCGRAKFIWFSECGYTVVIP